MASGQWSSSRAMSQQVSSPAGLAQIVVVVIPSVCPEEAASIRSARRCWTRDGTASGRMGSRFKFAIRTSAQPALEGLAAADLSPADVSLLIPQQSNVRLIRSICHQLGLREEKAFVDVDMCGNMSAASIPVTLCEAAA